MAFTRKMIERNQNSFTCKKKKKNNSRTYAAGQKEPITQKIMIKISKTNHSAIDIPRSSFIGIIFRSCPFHKTPYYIKPTRHLSFNSSKTVQYQHHGDRYANGDLRGYAHFLRPFLQPLPHKISDTRH